MSDQDEQYIIPLLNGDGFNGIISGQLYKLKLSLQEMGAYILIINTKIQDEWNDLDIGVRALADVNIEANWRCCRMSAHIKKLASVGAIAFMTRRELRQALADKMVERIEAKGGRVQHTKAPQSGFVYLLRAETGHCKIGRAKNHRLRTNALITQMPYKAWVETVIESGDYIRLERELHDRFSEKRVNGEWFSLTNDDIEWFKTYQPEITQ